MNHPLHSPRTQRRAARLAHLIAAALIGTYIYAPAHVTDPLRAVLQFVVVPAATLTGVFIWKQAAVRRVFSSRRRRP